ncbi:MAG TPA: FlgD immunoglobulin-like domain containing protein, partial [Candidatus Krumholzibacteria bacterium]|nr:FlgD immunoglobulin-like domain containing protein [Candidatus Krumholzibacteria bacterium]
PGHDKWVLAAGRDPFNPSQQNVYIAWTWNIPTPAGNVDQQIASSRSTDSGATFSVPLVINDDSIAGRDGGLVADPSVGPNGEVYVSWNDIQLTDAAILVDRSLDGGLTWGSDVLVSNPTMAWRTPIPPQPDRGVGAAPVMDVDRSGGPYSGRSYIVYAQPGAFGLDILLRYSDDQAQTWSGPVRVNDDATMNDQFLPWIDAGSSNGVVGVIFYDTREDPLNGLARTYAAISYTGGASFEPNLPVADVQSNNSTSNAFRYPGNYLEYIGVAVGDEAIHMVWTDTRWQWPVNFGGGYRYYYDSIAIQEPPVPVLFAALDAVWSNGHVEVTWQLQSDEAMDGFLIYRGEGTSAVTEIARGPADTRGSYIDAAVSPGKTYRYEMLVRTMDDDEFRSRVATVTTPATILALGQNHPNPFNPRTTIPYAVPASAHPQHVKLLVLDVAGRLVRTLVDKDQAGGEYDVDWDGANDHGEAVSSGIYFSVLDVSGERRARKMVLLK